MYALSDQQIDYILNDIKLRGVEMEDLQQNLLDHVCCIMEREIQPGDDFHALYQQTIHKFFKAELKEIEEETILLLTFKNYYKMKKAMIISGAFSVATFVSGSFFKLMHWPGASILLVSGIVSISFIFLPLLFILKTREMGSARDKTVLALGTLVGILFCLGTVFKVQHWPGANILWFSSIGISFLVFIPLYFFTGIRRAETKVNTIVSTILFVVATGLQFTLINIRPSHHQTELRVHAYLQNNELLKAVRAGIADTATGDPQTTMLAVRIDQTCEQLKELIMTNTLGIREIPKDFEEKNVRVEEGNLGNEFFDNRSGVQLLAELKKEVREYNALKKEEGSKLPLEHSILDVEPDHIGSYSNLFVLNSITQLQLYLVHAERNLVAVK